MNIIGRYEGIKYRFTYKEYCSEDVDEPIAAFQFTWPGRIPEDKELAEKGIQAMFTKQLNDGAISYKVIKDDIDLDTSAEEEKALYEIINEEVDFSDELSEDSI